MKKKLLLITATLFAFKSIAQHATFENPVLTPESAWYGQDQVTDGDTIYTSQYFNFETNYNAGWGSFSGWSVSNVTDNATPGWGNQFSAITGVGADGSGQYGVCYVSSWEGNRMFFNSTDQELIPEIFITNTTYAYYAMLNGDDFTKPFGADTNAQGVIDGTNGEDWFLLTIYGLNEDSLYTGDSVNFYLADFRFADDSQDYIIDEWVSVDLTSLGHVKGLDFVLTSSDTSGGFGMNNPSYFAMDNVIAGFNSVDEYIGNFIKLYPNPTNGLISANFENAASVQIFDVSGKLIFETIASETTFTFDFSDFQAGIYFMDVISEGKIYIEKIIKQ